MESSVSFTCVCGAKVNASVRNTMVYKCNCGNEYKLLKSRIGTSVTVTQVPRKS